MSQPTEPDKTPGIISWTELNTRDGASSRAFYTGLFGWQSEEISMGSFTYTMFQTGEHTVAGMYSLPPDVPGSCSMWMNYITVENLEASVAKAVELGATICREITEIPMGRFAIIQDPQGAIVGLWQFH